MCILRVFVNLGLNICGTVNAINSKSYLHRAIICSALCPENTRILNVHNICTDVKNTVDCVKSFSDVDFDVENINIKSNFSKSCDKIFNCGESGSTLRFLLPVVSALGFNAHFDCEESLKKRPIKDFIETLELKGAVYSNNSLPFDASGKLSGGKYITSGSISSQFISGLMFALPLLKEDSEIILTDDLQSKSYVDLTISVLNEFGIEVAKRKNGYYIKGNQRYTSPGIINVECDWSNTAFFLALGALGGSITVNNISKDSFQGDKQILNILENFGADVSIVGNSVTVKKNKLKGISISIKNIPDLAPIIAVLGMFADGETVIYDTERLKYKESNRVEAICSNINRIGGCAESTDNKIIVRGSSDIIGGEINSYNDHRIVMAFSVASVLSQNPIIIDGAEAVNKSYPSFFEDLEAIGGKINIIE